MRVLDVEDEPDLARAIARGLRREGTAVDIAYDRGAGLELRADDHLPKPFDFAELVARVRALGRRSPARVPPVLQRDGITLDPARRSITGDGRPVDLTPKEFAVLQVLLEADGRVVSTEELLEKAWDENADPFANAVRVSMMTLRRSLGKPALIDTVFGAGYRL